jgi:hypothetical protein
MLRRGGSALAGMVKAVIETGLIATENGEP